jgi:transcriptional regulator with XRE-family HTH domain
LKDERRRGVFFRMFSKGKLEESLVREFGDYLKEKRVKANLSQAEVAEELGYSSPQFVSNFERGLCTPPLSALKQMLSLYNISKKEMVELLVRQERKHIELALSTSGKGSKKVH